MDFEQSFLHIDLILTVSRLELDQFSLFSAELWLLIDVRISFLHNILRVN